jgi:hypothetical protein
VQLSKTEVEDLPRVDIDHSDGETLPVQRTAGR